jgi:hypothetical protein
MSRKFYFSFLAFALTLAATVALVVGHNTGTRAASTNAALSALPASDFVISIDAQRALNETLPSILASNPTQLAKLNAELEKFERETGINPRVFESIAIGGRLDPSKYTNSGTVVIVRGSFNSNELLERAFAKAQERGERFKKEEQQYEGKRIFLISPSEKQKAGDGAGRVQGKEAKVYRFMPEGDKDVDYRIEPLGSRMAVTALDANTLAVGNLLGVRAAIDASLGRGRVDDELVRLASESPNAVVGFSGKFPPSVAEKASRNNTIEKYIASIRQFYGSFGMSGSEAEAFVALRTETVEQAGEIGQALNAIKSLSAFGFSQSSGGNSAKETPIADILKGLSITTQGNEIQINVRIPQASVAPFVRPF